MPANQALLPELLVTYLHLVGVVAARGAETLMAAVALVLHASVQEIVEDLSEFLVVNWTDLVRFDIESRGLNWHGSSYSLIVSFASREKHSAEVNNSMTYQCVFLRTYLACRKVC